MRGNGLDGRAGAHGTGATRPVADPEKFVDDALNAPGYTMAADGLYWDPGEGKPAVKLSPPFKVVARTRDAAGNQWGLLLQWHDPDRQPHEWAMPLAALGGGREEIWREFYDGGLRITTSPWGRDKLAGYLSSVRVKLRARAVAQIGWYVTPTVAAFVLPDKTYGEPITERIRWQTETRSETLFREAGTLEEWRHLIGRRCIGNSRLLLAVAAGFAPPLLNPADEENGGLHFLGKSHYGKTTLLYAAGSVLRRRTHQGLPVIVAIHHQQPRSGRRRAL
jgi:hypothetical protein